MTPEDAFLSPHADDLFASIAAFGDAKELEMLDVVSGQKEARLAINSVIDNALRHKHNPGARLALIKGDAGSGKSHVLTTTFKRAASRARDEVYPAILQLTAPVKPEEYEIWLLDAIIRQLSARHFADDNNHSPLRRLAGRLLDRLELAEKEKFLHAFEDIVTDDEINLAIELAERISKEAAARLGEAVPIPEFIAVVLLAGFGDASALNYLRHGKVGRRIKELELDEPTTAHERIDVLNNLALTAQIVGASIALGFDQVENTLRLGSRRLFVHALTQAVRIAESIVNCAIVIVVLGAEYDKLATGKENQPPSNAQPSEDTPPLAVADRDRIEQEEPFAVSLDLGTPKFLRDVIALRLAVLRERAKLPQGADPLDPLPEWFCRRIDEARSVRLALREVAMLRLHARKLIRLPTQPEYEGSSPENALEPAQETDFDKEWADFLDSGGSTLTRLLDSKKAELLSWWAEEASCEHLNAEPAEVTRAILDDAHKTPIIEILLKSKGEAIARRRLALCEAPNRNQQLANQIERFLAASDAATPAVLRTNGFPKGRTSQVAPALRALEQLSGLKLDLGNTEWHNLARAKDFFDKTRNARGFSEWRRDKQWLLQWLAPLQPFIAFPEVLDIGPQPVQQQDDGTKTNLDGVSHQRIVSSDDLVATPAEIGAGNSGGSKDPFPVHIGTSFDGASVQWAPFREAPTHLNNFSVLITGDAGSGKTQTIRVLIDAACQVGLALTIFDFKADYCDENFARPLGIEVIDVRTNGLPFNPLQPPPGGASGAQPIEHVYEFAGILKRVFGLGAVQGGHLRDAIIQAYKEQGIDAREWIDPASKSWPTFSRVLDILRDKGDEALVTRLSLLSDLGLFGAGSPVNASFEIFLKKRVCLKLNDLPNDEVKTALAEILIVQLHGHALRGDQPRHLTRLMVFDEAHRVKDSKRLEQLAREGRAFGVGIVIGTQFPGDIPETMAGNLATQLFLMNNQAGHRRHVVIQLLGTTSTSEAKGLLDKLGQLRPLQGLFTNAHHNGVFVNILPHYMRHPA